MNQNVEIKAHVHDLARMHEVAARLSGSGPEILEQHDVFYNCPTGRLKLRSFPTGIGELIYYHRPDAAGPKTSSYWLTRVPDANSLAATLAAALGEVGVVDKTRSLYLVGRTRIHVDRVAGLGDFLELEVVLGDGESVAGGEEEAQALLIELGVASSDLIEGAYIDLQSS